MAYAAHLNSLYRAIFVANVETGETKQVTDGLADAMWPAWDASGKYLWFLASTDFGLRSQWLDMTSYDRAENFGLYLAVLKKGEPSPLLPESDEDAGIQPAARRPRRRRRRASRPADAPAEGGDQPAADRRAPAKPVAVQIDFDGLQQRDRRGARRARAATTRRCRPASPARCSTSSRRRGRGAAAARRCTATA